MERNGKKIWVVDDDTSIKELMKEVLEKEGYEVMPLDNGRQLYLNLQRDNPNLIILDIVLGRENGINICQRLKKSTSIPVLLVSATKFNSYEIINSCADSFIQKPFSLENLISTVQALTQL